MLFGVRFRWVLSGALTFLLGIFLFLALVVAGCRVISEEITPEDLRPGEVMVAGTRPRLG